MKPLPVTLLAIVVAANTALMVGLAGSESVPSATPGTVPTVRLLDENAASGHASGQDCHVWGPFNESGSVAEVRSELEARGAVATVLETAVYAEPDYLVFIGPESSGDAARRIHRELTSLGIDNHVIGQGRFASAVSVGLFADRGRAMAQRARVGELGFTVKVHELERSHPVYHVMAHTAQAVAGARPDVRCAAIAPPEHIL